MEQFHLKASDRLYHLVNPADWAERLRDGLYDTPDRADIGFIHLCTESQLAETVSRHYPNSTGLLVLTIDPAQLGTIVHEDTSGHGIFPHCYGPIPETAIVAVDSWCRNHHHGN